MVLSTRNKQLQDTIMYLMDAYRRQKKAPNAAVLAWLEKERIKVHKTVSVLQSKIRSTEARKASREVLIRLNALASDARLSLINRNLARVKRMKTSPKKSSSAVRKTTAKPKPKPWR